MITRESKKRRLDLSWLAAVVLVMVFATSALATVFIPGDTSVGTWDPVNRIYTLTTDVSETVGNAIEIDEDDLTLDGAGHTMSSPGGMWWSHGVYLNGRTGVTIKNLNVEAFSYSTGIFLENSSSNTLTANTISNNGLGIQLWDSSGNTLTDNTALNNSTGILLNWYSSNNTLTGNIASNIVRGISLGYSSNNNTLTGNTASNNQYGIWLDSPSGNALTGNTLTGNTVSYNTFYGIYLYSNCSGNEIYNNNFIGNTTQARVTNSSGNLFNLSAPIGGNYWSDHTGPDADNDGIVDSPYVFDGGQDDLPWVVQDGWLIPPVAIEKLILQVMALDLQKGIDNSLDAKLDAAFKALDDVNANNNVAAINALQAFINVVEAQRGNKISDDDADALIAAVNEIIAMLSSP